MSSATLVLVAAAEACCELSFFTSFANSLTLHNQQGAPCPQQHTAQQHGVRVPVNVHTQRRAARHLRPLVLLMLLFRHRCALGETFVLAVRESLSAHPHVLPSE